MASTVTKDFKTTKTVKYINVDDNEPVFKQLLKQLFKIIKSISFQNLIEDETLDKGIEDVLTNTIFEKSEKLLSEAENKQIKNKMYLANQRDKLLIN